MLSVLTMILIASPPLTLNARVDGEGYMRFVHEGRVVYASSATLRVVGSRLSHDTGAAVLPIVRIPATATQIEITLDGEVLAVTPVGTVSVGRLVLAVFPPDAVTAARGPFVVSTHRPHPANPGDGLSGVIRMDGLRRASVAAVPDEEVVPALHIKPAQPPVTPKEMRIVVNKESESAGDRILLGEIAQVEAPVDLAATLQAVEVGDTPPIGAARGLDRRQLLARLRKAGFNIEESSVEVPVGAVVRRRSQVVPTDALAQVAIDAASKALGANLPLTAKMPAREFRAPIGQVELAAESCTASANSASVIVVVRVDGKRFNSRLVRVAVDPSATAVKPGAPITLVIRSGGATVELPGKAKTSGYVGHMVAVQTNTGVDMSGVVIDAARVEVRL